MNWRRVRIRVALSALNLENPAFSAETSRMIERHVAAEVEEVLSREAGVVLLGPRQVGKTTLALEIGKSRNALYLDLESPEDRSRLDAANQFFESAKDRLVILDEVHRLPEVFPILRGVIDRGRREGKGTGRFLLLGSAELDISQQAGESLAGRVAYRTISPLLANEVDHDSMNRLWVRGGFPQPYLAPDDRTSFQERLGMIRAYLERDIPLFGPRVPLETMERLWTMLAHHHGGMLNASELAQAIETSTRSINRYIDTLVDLMLVRRLRPYSANLGKRLVKAPRVYVRDTGLLHALLGISDLTGLLSHPVVGRSWEGFVVENLLAVLPFLRRGYFYRTHTGAEIDLVIEHNDFSTWAIEIKRSQAMKPEKGFHIARQDVKATRSFVVHAGDQRFSLGEGIEAIGLTDMMEELQRL